MGREIGRNRSGLRFGYTTGSCAAAAAKAAVRMLLSGEEIFEVSLMTPKGIGLNLEVEETGRTSGWVQCAVRKFSGDDPDVTDGLLIFARVEKTGGEEILLEGGSGVGRVTKPGLEQPVGSAAINRVPRRMIREAVREVCGEYGYTGGIRVTVYVPGGEETAKRTFNPRLGIEGGISILGTTGIVEPMSEKALTDTIFLEMKMLHESGHDYCFVVPGNYGADFLEDALGADPALAVKCSNYVGETVDDGKILGMKGLLFIGHAGKFIKLAAGVMNTHSRQADCRMEVLAAHAAMAGASKELVRKIMGCINTDEALQFLRQAGILETVMETVMERIGYYLGLRAGEEMEIAAVMFSGREILGMTRGAKELLETIRSGEDNRKIQEEDRDDAGNIYRSRSRAGRSGTDDTQSGAGGTGV